MGESELEQGIEGAKGLLLPFFFLQIDTTDEVTREKSTHHLLILLFPAMYGTCSQSTPSPPAL